MYKALLNAGDGREIAGIERQQLLDVRAVAAVLGSHVLDLGLGLVHQLKPVAGAETVVDPRVDGTAGRDAVALGTQILDSLRQHAWEGDAAGPCGPNALPAPLGALFAVAESQAA